MRKSYEHNVSAIGHEPYFAHAVAISRLTIIGAVKILMSCGNYEEGFRYAA